MPRLDNLAGKRFGKWSVLYLAPKDSNGHTMWHCRCDCGNEKDISAISLKSGRTQSCGCSRSPSLVGKRFGRLTVVSYFGKTEYGSLKWNCQCDCGNEVVVFGNLLKSGHTQSCGCLSRESIKKRSTTHGGSDSRLYRIWHGMKARCFRTTDQNYCRYGGRGITVCNEWKTDFKAFYDWAISHGYADDLTIDRIDNDGDYCPENCRWVGAKTQCNNKSTNTRLTANGETHTVAEWAEILNTNDTTISARISRGWPEEKIINTPYIHYRRNTK